jgi:hypothetical protein
MRNAQAAVSIDDLVALSNEHSQRLPSRARAAGLGCLEGMRQVRVCEQLPGDRFGIDGIALTPARSSSAVIESTPRTDVSHVGSSLDERHGQFVYPGS